MQIDANTRAWPVSQMFSCVFQLLLVITETRSLLEQEMMMTNYSKYRNSVSPCCHGGEQSDLLFFCCALISRCSSYRDKGCYVSIPEQFHHITWGPDSICVMILIYCEVLRFSCDISQRSKSEIIK